MTRYVIIVERIGDGFSAYVPALPGCIATASTRVDVIREIAEAIRFHVAGLCEDGQLLPEPTTNAPPERALSASVSEDPFCAFVEWAGEIDTEVYADL